MQQSMYTGWPLQLDAEVVYRTKDQYGVIWTEFAGLRKNSGIQYQVRRHFCSLRYSLWLWSKLHLAADQPECEEDV